VTDLKPPLEELTILIDELVVDADFVAVAAQLRPRLNGVIRWEGLGKEERGIVQSFLRIKESRPEGLYGPLLVRLLALFERYVRRLIVWTVERRNSAAGKYEDLSQTIANRNRMLTGRVLSSAELPDHLIFDIPTLIENLASCRAGGSFRLNPTVFSFGIAGCSPKHLDTALEHVDIGDYWDSVGKDPQLTKLLGTKGARATGTTAKDKLKELSRLRNHLAHGGDGTPLISETDLRDAITFITTFSKALEELVLANVTA
jgi:hypothetical protein